MFLCQSACLLNKTAAKVNLGSSAKLIKLETDYKQLGVAYGVQVSGHLSQWILKTLSMVKSTILGLPMKATERDIAS